MITLSMIVKNEDKLISDCLKSVKGLADEIVIVDTGSTDNTVAVAEQFGAKIYHYRWKNDFAAARNYCLSKIMPGSWVLSLDADEVLSPESFKILKAIEKQDPAGAVFFLKVLSFTSDKLNPEETNEAQILRFFKNDGIQYDRPIHEELLADGYQRIISGAVILHLGYTPSLCDSKKKFQRNIDGIVTTLLKDNTNTYFWYQLGMTYYTGGHFQEARHCFNIALTLYERNGKKVLPYMVSCYSLKSATCNRLGLTAEGKEACKKGLSLDPNFYELHFSYGQNCLQEGDLKEAEIAFKNALVIGNNPEAGKLNLAAADKSVKGWKSCLELGNIKALEKDYLKAIYCLGKGLDLNPENKLILNNLLHCIEEMSGASFEDGLTVMTAKEF